MDIAKVQIVRVHCERNENVSDGDFSCSNTKWYQEYLENIAHVSVTAHTARNQDSKRMLNWTEQQKLHSAEFQCANKF